MRVFSYVRVSTSDQEYSPEAQFDQCRLYARARSHEVVAEFEETPVSGSVPFEQRERGRELLARIGEVDAIVFAKLDRAFRDTVDCILTVERLHAAGKTVHFLDLGVDTSTPAGGLCMEMMAAFAKFERRRISDRTREAMAVARGRGVKIGPAPFGYDNVIEFDSSGRRTGRGRHERNGEYVVVERVLQLAAGHGPTRIAEILNGEGVPTRDGGRWSKTHIRRIMAREKASGECHPRATDAKSTARKTTQSCASPSESARAM